MIKAVGKKDTQLVEEKYALKGLYTGERLLRPARNSCSPPLGKAVWREAPEKRCFQKHSRNKAKRLQGSYARPSHYRL